MKKILSLSLILIFSQTLFAQMTEHSDREHTLTIGSGLPIVQKTMLQFEHNLGSNWSIGENIAYHYGLLGSDQVWSGPKLEVLGRYYFSDQTIKHGGNWFAQIKAGGAFLTNPLASVDGFDKDLVVLDNNGIPVLDNNGNDIKIFENGDNWLSIGGGLSIGYKNISCTGWVIEAFIGYHYWSSPNYFTKEFENWVEDPQNIYDQNINLTIEDVEDGTDQLWKLTYGFPIDLQIKVGKILNW